MSAPIYTPATLAELLATDEPTILRWRRQYEWPSIKVGNRIRFTAEHVEQIIARHEAKHEPATDVAGVLINGQTSRSAARSA